MKRKYIPIFLLLILIVISSCGKNGNDIENADKRLMLIKKLIAENKLDEAKVEIDSVHVLFPKLVDKRKMAVALKDTIVLRESYKMLSYCEQTLPDLKKMYENSLQNFVLEKNEKYDEFGKYVYKTQLTEQNAGRNYLSIELVENGDVFLISHYSGSKINHSKLRINALDVTVASDTTNSSAGVLHAFNDGVAYYENLTFRNEADGGIAGFIAANKTSDIKVTLIGSRSFSYLLGEKDKTAIATSYSFAKTKKAIVKVENDMRIAKQRIGKIKLLYN